MAREIRVLGDLGASAVALIVIVIVSAPVMVAALVNGTTIAATITPTITLTAIALRPAGSITCRTLLVVVEAS